jgi:hypothetical protein
MKTKLCHRITTLRHKSGMFVSTEPIYQAISDCYDQTGMKITSGRESVSEGLCTGLSFHLHLN